MRYNLLYKTWADRPSVYMDTLCVKCKKKKKKKNERKNEKIKTKMLKTPQNVHMYISLDTDKDCDLLHERPVLSTGRTPHDKQNRSCLDHNQNLVMSPGGANCQDGRTDGRTDRPTDRHLQK